MKNSYSDGIVISNKLISNNIYKLVLKGEFEGQPGQFYMIRGWSGLDPFLPRPISIADLGEGHITFLYEARGKGTQIISKLSEGMTLSILGPLGNGFDYKTDKKIALVSGGIGIAPMLYLAKSLDKKPDLYAGFRNQGYYLDELSSFVENIHVSTEDGSEGYKGYVIDLLEPSKYDTILTCGPIPMMKSVIKKCEGITPVYISMEARMACGVGACLGCTINTTNGIKRVCKDGPVFKGEEVILND